MKKNDGVTVTVTVLVPIHNEESILWEKASVQADVYDRLIGPGNWKFLFVNNASTDNSEQVITKICSKWQPSQMIYEPKPNYGSALRAGMNVIDTPFVMITDIDQWDEIFTVWSWNNKDEYDLIIGSKLADPTICTQSNFRKLLSWGLNSLIHLAFNHSGTDTHGPKLVRMQDMKSIISQCHSDRGQYDTELVLRAVRARRSIVEVPVDYNELRPPRNLMIKKILWNLYGIYKLYLKMKSIPFQGTVKMRKYCRDDLLEAYFGFLKLNNF